jgi:hypothetical protein
LRDDGDKLIKILVKTKTINNIHFITLKILEPACAFTVKVGAVCDDFKKNGIYGIKSCRTLLIYKITNIKSQT